MPKHKLSLAVVGSRSFENKALMDTWIRFCINSELPSDIEIVSGGARGADGMARQWAESNGVAYKEFPADWSHYGPSAGMK